MMTELVAVLRREWRFMVLLTVVLVLSIDDLQRLRIRPVHVERAEWDDLMATMLKGPSNQKKMMESLTQMQQKLDEIMARCP